LKSFKTPYLIIDMQGKALAGVEENHSHNHCPPTRDLPELALLHQLESKGSGSAAPFFTESFTPEMGVCASSSSDDFSVLAPLKSQMEAVENEIAKLVTTPVQVVAQVAAHSLQAGGKRLRPALTILCAQLCGDGTTQAAPRVLTSAAVVELTHTTTLLHDDVVDEASTRRGKASANSVWGNQTSVLVGDYLFAQVFVTLSKPEYMEMIAPLALATARMCAGELQETQMRHSPELDEAQYRQIIALKTASLIECACHLGALSMQADKELTQRLGQFGHYIGMTFQIIDDVLDLTASAGRLGKPVGHDIREGDVTLPMLRALEQCNEQDSAELRAIIENPEVNEADVQRAIALIRSSDAIEYSHAAAQDYADKARQILVDFPENTTREMLEKITDYVVSRDH
jgi:geranylgeranyl pyrophosphate synthase